MIDRTGWEPVTVGRSAAHVLRRPGSYLKVAARCEPEDAELADEVAAATWLRGHGLPAAEVLDTGSDDDETWAVFAELPGRSLADPWPAHRRRDVVRALADLTRAVHAVPVARCPFDRRLRHRVPAARSRLAAGRVDLDDLDADRSGWTAAELAASLTAALPAALEREPGALAVTHGDLCCPNVLLDPDTLTPTGLVDVGRLGVADRHQDLALATRSLGPINGQYGGDAAALYLDRYGGEVDPDRIAFYRLLDEFF